MAYEDKLKLSREFAEELLDAISMNMRHTDYYSQRDECLFCFQDEHPHHHTIQHTLDCPGARYMKLYYGEW